MRPGCAGTTPGSGSGPKPSPRSRWSPRRTSRLPRPSWPAPGAPGRPATRPRQRVRNPYALRGRLYCGFCERRMQGQYNHGHAYYRCRYPKEYALASHVRHPGNVYLREADVLPAIDRWLAVIFAPHRLTQTIREMQAAQAPPATPEPAAPAQDTRAILADCDARLARYQAALDAGADPQTIAEWTRQVKAERAAALARDASQTRRQPSRRLTEDDIRALIAALGRPARRHPRRRARREGSHLRPARPQGHLQARRSKNPGRSHHRPGELCRACIAMWGYGSCPRGDLNPHAPFRALAPQASASAYSATRTYARPRYLPGRPPHDSKSCRVRRSSCPPLRSAARPEDLRVAGCATTPGSAPQPAPAPRRPTPPGPPRLRHRGHARCDHGVMTQTPASSAPNERHRPG